VRIETRNTYISILILSILFGVSTIMTTKAYIDNTTFKYIRYMTIAVLFALVMIKTNVTRIPKNGIPFYIIWTIFSITAFISALYNNGDIIGSIWYLVGVPLVFFIAFPKYFNEKALELVTKALLIGHIPYLLISLMMFQIKYPFKGLFTNPNQMGTLGAVLGCGSLIFLNSQIKRRSKLRTVAFSVVLVILSLLTVFISGSRTSLITIGILIIIFIFVNANIHSTYDFRTFTVIGFAGLALAYIVYQNNNYVISGMIDKIQSHSNPSTILSGRLYIWEKTLEDATLLGHGRDYFANNFVFGAHNSLIGILGEYGIIPTIFMIIFAVFGILLALKFYFEFKNTNSYSIAPLMIMVTFWALSMGEGLFGLLGRGITLAYYTVTGITIYQWSTKRNKAC
jgi:O-antigen ligase